MKVNSMPSFNKNLALLLSGHIVSQAGTIVFNTALVWWVATHTGSSKILGIIFAISLLPLIIMNLFGGVIVDRYNKKHILVIVDFISGFASLALGFYSLYWGYDFYVILVANTIINTGFSFFRQQLEVYYQNL